MVACKMEARSEHVHVACTFLDRLAPICMLTRCLVTKLLHRNSVGSLSRVRRWLGRSTLSGLTALDKKLTRQLKQAFLLSKEESGGGGGGGGGGEVYLPRTQRYEHLLDAVSREIQVGGGLLKD